MLSGRVGRLAVVGVVLCAVGGGSAQAASLPAVVAGSTSWELRDTLTGGPATSTFSYGTPPTVPLFGDWNGDGLRTAGTYEGGVFKLRNSNSAGAADITFTFGDPRGFPVAGDFNGDGVEDVAVFRSGSWQVRLSTGTTLIAFAFGSGSWPATVPVAGDWNGDGTDGIGTYTYATASWGLRNSASLGATDVGPFAFGTANSTYPVVGDWNGDGTDTAGVRFAGATPTWQYRNANSAGTADGTFIFGSANALPLTWSPGDPPVDITLSPASVAENQPTAHMVGSLSAVDPDVAGSHTFSLVSGAGDTDNASFQISGSNTLTTNAVFDFEAKSSYSIRVRTTDAGNNTFEKQLTITITNVNEAPVTTNDSYSGAIGNTKASRGVTVSGEPAVALTGNVLTTNDSDPDGDALTAVPETVSSTGGGTATISANGAFVFVPGVGDKNQNDTFAYKATDGSLQSTGTVTVGIANHLVWYVDRDAASNGDGRSSSPLQNLAGINGAGGAGDADGTSDVIFLYSSANPYTGGLPLEASQQLIGEPQGLTVNSVSLVPAGGTNPVVQNAGGTAIVLANGVMTRRVNVGTTSGDGIAGTSITTADIGGTSTISGVTGTDFKVSGGNGNISFGPAITNTAGRSVDIQDRTGGTVTLSGAIGDTGTGIFLDDNATTTVAFNGDVDASTGASPAFTATDGGTVTAVGAGKTLATTTGTALNVAGTTIGTGGLNFQSISSNGAASGIVLSNTGTTAGLTVAGTGSAPSGGTIQNATSVNGAIALTNTGHVSLNNMSIQGANRSSLVGAGVTNFSFTNSVINNGGDTKTSNADSALNFASNPLVLTQNNLDGVVTIAGNTITNSYGASIDISQRAGTISDANISSNVITTAVSDLDSKEEGISIHLNGSNTTVASMTKGTINNNTVSNVPSGPGIFFDGGNAAGDGIGESAPAGTYGVPGSATNVITISGNKVKGTAGVNMNGAAIAIGVTGRGLMKAAVTNNGTAQDPLTNVAGVGIGIGAAGNVTGDFTVTGNVLVPNSEFNSPGIGVGVDKNIQADLSTLSNPSMNATVSNNTVSNSNGAGVRVLNSDSNGTLNLKLQNNTINQPTGTGTAAAGVRLENGSSGSASFNPTMCATVSGNTATAGAADAFGDRSPGFFLEKASTSATTYKFGLTGLSPSPATNAQTEAHVAANNVGSPGAGFYAGKTEAVVNFGSNFTSCTLPF